MEIDKQPARLGLSPRTNASRGRPMSKHIETEVPHRLEHRSKEPRWTHPRDRPAKTRGTRTRARRHRGTRMPQGGAAPRRDRTTTRARSDLGARCSSQQVRRSDRTVGAREKGRDTTTQRGLLCGARVSLMAQHRPLALHATEVRCHPRTAGIAVAHAHSFGGSLAERVGGARCRSGREARCTTLPSVR